MLANNTVSATVAVSDVSKAKDFYGNILGLKLESEFPGGVAYLSGSGRLLVYESNTAGKNEATSAGWEVTGIEALVEELKNKGLSFESYDMPGVTQEGDIHVAGPMKAAWFKDPDGNILGLAESPAS